MDYERAWFSLKETFLIVKKHFTTESVHTTDDWAELVIGVMDDMEKKTIKGGKQ